MPRKPTFDKDDLIDRARDLFWAQGWAGTSLKDLEKTLQIKPGSFYAAFGSKDRLYELALNKYAEDGAERISRLAKKHGALGALKTYPMLLVETTNAAAKACMLAKTILELSPRQHPLAAYADTLLVNMENRFADLFETAMKTGEIAPVHNARTLARSYQSNVLGLRFFAERNGYDATEIAREIATGLDRL